MISTYSRRPRCRWKIPIAMLAVSAAFVGGGGTLAPAPASAVMAEEGVGVEECEFWIDCVADQQTGGGDGSSTGSGGQGVTTPAPTPGTGKPGETITVTGVAPSPPTCATPGRVCVGNTGSPPPEVGKDHDGTQPPPRGGGVGRPLPPCKSGAPKDKKPGCSQHGYKCEAAQDDGTIKISYVNTAADCPPILPPKPKKVLSPRLRRRLCSDLQSLVEGLDKSSDEGAITPEDYRTLTHRYQSDWERLDCWEFDSSNPESNPV
jgi:hypothetical protein